MVGKLGASMSRKSLRLQNVTHNPMSHLVPMLENNRIVKAKGGGWVSRLTGRIWTGLWRFIGVGPPFGDDRNRYVELESIDAEFQFQPA
jgi:hypothetical protein